MKSPQLIYYLDDDNDDLQYFREVADALGHRVSLFIDGNELLRALRKQEPDVIFLDIHMPVFNGEEILHVIKRVDEWKNIPIVMISGIFQKKLVRRYLESGANYIMKKPTSVDWKNALEEVLSIDWSIFKAYS
jgi:CheY-like chemotaxis protein